MADDLEALATENAMADDLGGRWNLADVPEDIEPLPPLNKQTNLSKYRGVSLVESLTPEKPDLWKAAIYAFGAHHDLGFFATEEEAGRYYARAHHKVFVVMKKGESRSSGLQRALRMLGRGRDDDEKAVAPEAVKRIDTADRIELDLFDIPEDMEPVPKNRREGGNKYRGTTEYVTSAGGLQWTSNITHQGKNYKLGRYPTELEAARVYARAYHKLKVLGGKKAKLEVTRSSGRSKPVAYAPSKIVCEAPAPTLDLSDVPLDVEPMECERGKKCGSYRGVIKYQSGPHIPAKYKASITHLGSTYWLGSFDDELEAGRIYARAHLKLFGSSIPKLNHHRGSAQLKTEVVDATAAQDGKLEGLNRRCAVHPKQFVRGGDRGSCFVCVRAASGKGPAKVGTNQPVKPSTIEIDSASEDPEVEGAAEAFQAHVAQCASLPQIRMDADEVSSNANVYQIKRETTDEPIGVELEVQRWWFTSWSCGVAVAYVDPGSSAERAGVRVGDILEAANDTPLIAVRITKKKTLPVELLLEPSSATATGFEAAEAVLAGMPASFALTYFRRDGFNKPTKKAAQRSIQATTIIKPAQVVEIKTGSILARYESVAEACRTLRLNDSKCYNAVRLTGVFKTSHTGALQTSFWSGATSGKNPFLTARRPWACVCFVVLC
jgi:hypothetical protein